MDQPFDPKDSHSSPADEPLDLGAFRALEVSDHTPSALDAAVARGPQPRALGNMDFLARQTNGDEEKTGRFSKLFKRDNAKDPQATEQEPKKKGMTRREVLLKGSAVAAGAYGVYRGVSAVYAPNDYHLALLREDDQGHMGIVHRSFSTAQTDGLVEPAKTSLSGLSAESLDHEGLESLLISPEMKLRALPRDRNPTAQELREREKHKHDPQEISIKGTARNIYIPYHLFEDACRFNVSFHMEQEIQAWDDKPLKRGEREENIGGKQVKVALHPKIRISVWGYPEAEDIPFTQDIATGATNAKDAAGDAVTGIGNSLANGWDYVTGNSERAERRNEAEAKAVHDREVAKPKPTVEPKFMIELDYEGDTKLPDLLFYNGRTIDAPTYRIPREDIATGIRKQPEPNATPGMHLITHNGMKSDISVNGGIRAPQGVRYVDSKLEKAAHAARGEGSSPENGFLKDAWNGLKEVAWQDDKLEKTDKAALIMATHFQQNGFEARKDKQDGMVSTIAGERGRTAQGFINRLSDKLSDKPDHDVGR